MMSQIGEWFSNNPVDAIIYSIILLSVLFVGFVIYMSKSQSEKTDGKYIGGAVKGDDCDEDEEKESISEFNSLGKMREFLTTKAVIGNIAYFNSDNGPEYTIAKLNGGFLVTVNTNGCEAVSTVFVSNSEF